ncbi:MAG: class I SAM-dependent methyltransferase [Pirellulaceae bacterium]
MENSRTVRPFRLRVTWAILLMGAPVFGQVAPVIPDTPISPPRQFYRGRRIAQTMHFTGAEWLIRNTREREERCTQMIENLGVEPGMTVCDMGCGNGFYSLWLAKLVGPTGRVLSVDIQREMLRLLQSRAAEQNIANIKSILGSVADPNLPVGEVDLILCVDVYHEFSHPERMLSAMRRSLSPNGVVVLVEYRAEDKTVPIKPLHKMSKAQILKELPPNGLRLVKQYDELPWQHMMFFGRDETWKRGERDGETERKSQGPTEP